MDDRQASDDDQAAMITVEVAYATPARQLIVPLVGFTVCIFCSYRWKMSGLSEELSKGDPDYEGSLLQKYINLSLGTIIPVVLLVVFLSTVYQIYL